MMMRQLARRRIRDGGVDKARHPLAIERKGRLRQPVLVEQAPVQHAFLGARRAVRPTLARSGQLGVAHLRCAVLGQNAVPRLLARARHGVAKRLLVAPQHLRRQPRPTAIVGAGKGAAQQPLLHRKTVLGRKVVRDRTSRVVRAAAEHFQHRRQL